MKLMMKRMMFTLLLTGVVGTVCAESQNMIGNQSQNEGMSALPTIGEVKIDGDLSDWDLSGRIWVFADKGVRTRFSVECSAMWDSEAVYIAAKWKDSTPMFSLVNPAFNSESGWKSDSIQMRINSQDKTSWITTWYFTEGKQPVLHQKTWNDPKDARKGMVTTIHTGKPGGTDLGDGIAMAYKMDDDKKGYVQEIRIPWSLIYTDLPEIKPEQNFRIGFEFLWGDPTGGKLAPVHRYADNMQPGQTSREFFWSAINSWGDIKLLAKGNIPLREYVSEDSKIAGTIPVRAEIPKAAARFTIALNDADGQRIRNLAADCLPEDYSVEVKGDTRIVEVMWDGLDDWGKLVEPGSYSAIGLSHRGLGAEYDMTYYNPGKPLWGNAKGNGGWGSDHSPPVRVAKAGDWMILSWGFAEGGSGLIGVGPDGLKKWSEKRGAVQLAADEKYVYAIPSGWHIKENFVMRMDAKNGSYKPFILNGKELKLEYPIKDAVQDPNAGNVTGIAVHGTTLALALNEIAIDELSKGDLVDKKVDTGAMGMLALVNKETAQLISKVKIPVVTGIAFNSGGKVFGIHHGTIVSIDTQTGEFTAVKTPSLVKASAIIFDKDDNILVTDMGPDQQLKAYNANGNLVYTCGVKGGRPIRGDFNPAAMNSMSSVATDAKGQVWVVENTDLPRRISVWNPSSGQLVREYLGNAGYAGTGCYLHDDNSTLAYVGPIELKLDRKTKEWKVKSILWVPDIEAGESFPVPTKSHAHPQRFSAKVQGVTHEYLFVPGYRDYQGYIIYMERAGTWQPVSAITTAGWASGEFAHHGQVTTPPSGELAGLNAYDAVIWNDTNQDGKLQRAECDVFKATKPGTDKQAGELSIPTRSGWGERMSKDFVFYSSKAKEGIHRYTPVGFSDDGAPIYSGKSISKVSDNVRHGDMVPLDNENFLFLSWGRPGAYVSAVDTVTGKLKWHYPNPYPGVHGSHHATMPKPGVIMGPLKITGTAKINDQVGSVFGMRGNLGQDFYMTTDGLFISSMFQDFRLPGQVLPDTEAELYGMPIETFSLGPESFNGWFGKQDDGKIRTVTGITGPAGTILEIKGFETIKKFTVSKPVQVAAQDLVKADADNISRMTKAATPKNYQVKKLAADFKLDGKSTEWQDIPEMKLERKGAPYRGSAKMAYDDKNLYLLYTVDDSSPWLNGGKDFTRLFKTGDSVDLFLNVDPKLGKDAKRAKPAAGDVRILISQLNGKTATVLTMPIDPSASEDKKVLYQSPVMTKKHDRVEVMTEAQIKVEKQGNRYVVEAAIPLSTIGLVPTKGMTLRGDLGFISSDPTGMLNAARTYWSNKNTNLVSDLPQESWFTPQAWGELVFE